MKEQKDMYDNHIESQHNTIEGLKEDIENLQKKLRE